MPFIVNRAFAEKYARETAPHTVRFVDGYPVRVVGTADQNVRFLALLAAAHRAQVELKRGA